MAEPRERQIERSHNPSVRRYYVDLAAAREPFDAVMAVSRYADNALGVAQEHTEGLLRSVLVREGSSDREKREIAQKLMLFPIVYAGPVLESTDITPRELQLMYADGARSIRDIFDGEHDAEACLTNDLFDYPTCEEASNCPLRITSAYLLDDVYGREFDSLEYTLDAERTYEIAVAKALAARDGGLGNAQYIEEMIAYYHSDYTDCFGVT